jgi:diacylglycerol kinase (ATP)
MRIIAVVNPYAKEKRGRTVASTMAKKLSRSLASIEYTTSPEQTTSVARRAAREGFDTVIAVGGDGTVNAVLNGLAGSNTAMGIIPAGTANDLAIYHGIPQDPENACEILAQNQSARIDLICVNGRYYATDGGIGVPCEIARRANAFKQNNRLGRIIRKYFGSQAYVFMALRVLSSGEARRAVRLTIQSNGHSLTTDAMFLMVNNQHIVGKNFLLSPGARNDDGVFDVCLVEHVADGRGLVQLLARSMRGTHTQLSFVRTWRERTIRIQSEEPLPYLADGEILEEASDFTITLHPLHLNVIIPFQPYEHRVN